MECEGPATVFPDGDGVATGAGVGVSAGRIIAVGLAGTLVTAPGQATTTERATRRAVATPARVPATR